MLMEMESSRRPFDRTREPGLKKPRLADEAERGGNVNGRPFPQRPVASGANIVQPRFRANDRDSGSSDSGRGGYQPQLPQHQELVSQYRTALAELTFNSKPIITNLTIIAGENLPAAKAISATVCVNILEVPSEQKLPSLYLLDSIVKNIGRDYIKYFAARLPEVFCKAYRQVEPSVHASMRHLFGTWKGVFPPQTLQIIEKELGFIPTSSSGTITSKPDLPAQRPPHSIHVNPKYIERQRLQQSGRAKGMTTDVSEASTNVTQDAQAKMSTGRPWVDASMKALDIQYPLRDAPNDMAQEKNITATYADYECGSDLSRNSGMGRRAIDEGRDKPWSSAGSNVAEKFSGPRNGFNKLDYENYPAPKSANNVARLLPVQNFSSSNSRGLSTNWKNSEEEEFRWGEMNSVLSGRAASSIANNTRKDQWTRDDSDDLGIENKPLRIQDTGVSFEREASSDSQSSEQRELGDSGQLRSSLWQVQEPISLDGLRGSGVSRKNLVHSGGYGATVSALPGATSSVDQMGGRSQITSSNIGASGHGFLNKGASGSMGTVDHQRFPSRSMPPLHQRPPSPSLVDQHVPQQLHDMPEHNRPQRSLPRLELKSSSLSNVGSRKSNIQDSALNLPPSVRQDNLPKSQPQDLHPSASSIPASQARNQFSVPQPLKPDFTLPEFSSQHPVSVPGTDFRPPTSVGNSISDLSPAEILGQPSTSSLLAAVMKSGIFSNNSITSSTPTINFQDVGNMPPQSSVETSPPIRSSTHTQSTTSEPKIVGESPLLPGPLPTSSAINSASTEASNANDASSPISNLLSSLVAKGLISASKGELPNIRTTEMPPQSETTKSRDTVTSSIPVSSVPDSSSSLSSTGLEVLSEPAVKSSTTPPPSAPTEITNLIGFEFSSHIIRKFHPSVISGLFDDIPYQCKICGLRLRLQEQLDTHLEWHTLRTESNKLNWGSRRWYENPSDWVAGNSRPLLDAATSVDKSSIMVEDNEPMVPADENQFACVLCGDFFEDFYSHEKGEWMFRGATYINIPSAGDEVRSSNEMAARGPIVHANCITESSVYDLGLATDVKTEMDV